MKEYLRRILSVLNVEYTELFGVFLLMFQSFFLGINNGAFTLGSYSLFLKTYSLGDIPLAFIFSGIFGFLLTYLFYKAKSIYKYSSFFLITISLITSFVLFLNIGISIFNFRWAVYAAFVFLVPSNILTLLLFRSLLSRLYSNRQSVRLFGLFDKSMEIGIVAISYIIPLVLFLDFEVRNIFYLCTMSLFLALILEFIVARRYKITAEDDADIKNNPLLKHNLAVIRKDKFFQHIIWFLLLSAVLGYSIHYIFLTLANENFVSEVGLGKFFGIFFGTTAVFIFLVDRFILGRLLAALGMPYSAVLGPLVTGVFVLIAAVIGGITGSSTALVGFSFYFMMIVMAKITDQTFKELVEKPSVKLIYQLIDQRIRPVIRELIYGSIGSLTILLAGIFLTLLSLIKSFNPIHLSIVIIPMFFLWFWVSVKLIQMYRESLKKKFDEVKNRELVLGSTEIIHDVNINSLLYPQKESDENIIYLLKAVENIRPGLYFNLLIRFLDHKNAEVRKYTIGKIGDLDLFDAYEKLEKHIEVEEIPAIKEEIEKILRRFKELLFSGHTYESLADLTFSDNAAKKVYAAKYIKFHRKTEFKSLISVLLKDIEPEVKVAAMEASGALKMRESVPVLIDYLFLPHIFSSAYEALIQIEGLAGDSLDQLFLDNTINNRMLIRAIRILANNSNPESINRLLNKFDLLNKSLIINNIQSLRACGYKTDANTENVIIKVIVRYFEVCAWNMAAHLSCRTLSNNGLLMNALNIEIQWNYDVIFSLLSLIYDPKIIAYAKEKILEGQYETRGYALEVLELLIDEDLQNVLLPMFQDNLTERKIRQLQYYFPVEKVNNIELLNSLINRDYNQTLLWTKACAVYSYQFLKKPVVSEDLIACLFHSEKLIYETAANIISRIDDKILDSVLSRLDSGVRMDIEKSLEFQEKSEHLFLFNKIRFLKTVRGFRDIKEDDLLDIAKIMEEMTLNKNETFEFNSAEDNLPIIIILKGKFELLVNDSKMAVLEEGDLYDLLHIKVEDQNVIKLKAFDDAIYYVLERELLSYYLFDDVDLLNAIMSGMFGIDQKDESKNYAYINTTFI